MLKVKVPIIFSAHRFFQNAQIDVKVILKEKPLFIDYVLRLCFTPYNSVNDQGIIGQE
jgi:hypothetical protein